jgi:hypothetical protein
MFLYSQLRTNGGCTALGLRRGRSVGRWTCGQDAAWACLGAVGAGRFTGRRVGLLACSAAAVGVGAGRRGQLGERPGRRGGGRLSRTDARAGREKRGRAGGGEREGRRGGGGCLQEAGARACSWGSWALVGLGLGWFLFFFSK